MFQIAISIMKGAVGLRFLFLLLFFLLVFPVYYERPMVIDSLNLKLRQIARFLPNVILDEMLSAKYHLLFLFIYLFLIAQHEERPLYHIHMVASRCKMC